MWLDLGRGSSPSVCPGLMFWLQANHACSSCIYFEISLAKRLIITYCALARLVSYRLSEVIEGLERLFDDLTSRRDRKTFLFNYRGQTCLPILALSARSVPKAKRPITTGCFYHRAKWIQLCVSIVIARHQLSYNKRQRQSRSGLWMNFQRVVEFMWNLQPHPGRNRQLQHQQLPAIQTLPDGKTINLQRRIAAA